MKTIGLIGGTTWLSTVNYYTLLNRIAAERLGGSHSAKILMYSYDFDEVKPSKDIQKWKNKTSAKFTEAGLKLQNAGADLIAFCANTPHLFADEVAAKLSVPLISITEATAKRVAEAKIKCVGLLGTRITMEMGFYKTKFNELDIEVLVPGRDERDFINWSIFEELGKEIFTVSAKSEYLSIISNLKISGASGIILGCTEIPLIIKQTDCDLPLFDTTIIHSEAIMDYALS